MSRCERGCRKASGSGVAGRAADDGGLGDALPAGTVRFYQRDLRGDSQPLLSRTIDVGPAPLLLVP